MTPSEEGLPTNRHRKEFTKALGEAIIESARDRQAVALGLDGGLDEIKGRPGKGFPESMAEHRSTKPSWLYLKQLNEPTRFYRF